MFKYELTAGSCLEVLFHIPLIAYFLILENALISLTYKQTKARARRIYTNFFGLTAHCSAVGCFNLRLSR